MDIQALKSTARQVRRDIVIMTNKAGAGHPGGSLSAADILTALYGSRVKLIDSQLYNLSDRILAFYNASPLHPHHSLEWVRQNTVIIHYCGRNKPWKPGYVGILDVFYRELKEQQARLHPADHR